MPYCSYACKAKHYKEKGKKTKVNPISKTRCKESKIYALKRIAFLTQHTECEIKGSNCTSKATTIEHSMGRKGYADDWARDNNISLYLDERYWKASCHNCNLELENNPELSRKHQLSKIHGGKKDQKDRITTRDES